jgi:hypothetical protein
MAGFPKGDKRIGDKARLPHKGVKIDSELIKQALIKTRGNIARAADKIGCDRHVIHTRVNKEPDLKVVLDSCRERFLDDLEIVAQEKALSGDSVMTLFLLKTIGKKRGYDQDRDVITESTVRGALDFIANRSKNPAES